jgi:hypothetical protein
VKVPREVLDAAVAGARTSRDIVEDLLARQGGTAAVRRRAQD